MSSEAEQEKQRCQNHDYYDDPYEKDRVLVATLKEQSAIIREMRKEIDELRAQLNRRTELL